MSQHTTPYGNYKGYYTKRGNYSSDPRLKALPTGIFIGKRVLDVGCNEGWITCEIARHYDAREVIGVDIDAELIGRAWRHRREVWSLQAPAKPSRECVGTQGAESKELAVATAETQGLDVTATMSANDAYFPECFPNLFGPIPISTQNKLFPNNVSFHTSDWAKQGCSADQAGYDMVVAFSVSKWIHVHGGDEGIKHFFLRVRDVLRARTTKSSPGVFVLEAQPWSGYHNAMRKVNLHEPKEERPQDRVKINPEEFSGILVDIGFSQPQRAGIVGEGGFKRPIDIYELNDHDV